MNRMSSFKEKINLEKLPKHVAIIMDGNGRWAKKRGEERTFGHRNALEAVRSAIHACNEIRVPYLTLYTFSSENWNRPAEEVSNLMTLLAETLFSESGEIFGKGLRLHIIGDMEKLPPFVQQQLQYVMDLTAGNTYGNLILALSYGSRDEITHAVRQISEKVQAGELQREDITEECISDHLYTKNFPDVDLLIRTSGECRISNFLLWQIAYAELQFLDLLWPDFTKETFFQCILNYQAKERRFGLTGEQMQAQNND